MRVWPEGNARYLKRKCAGIHRALLSMRLADPTRQRLIFWLILVPIFAYCGRDGLRGQTQLNPRNTPWQQVNLDACAVPVIPPGTAGTRLNVAQLRFPVQPLAEPKPRRVINPGMTTGPGSPKKLATMAALVPLSSNCWPLDLQTNAWSVLNAKCTRCHGNDVVPGDVHLVDGLDLRTFQSMRTGGNRGPAVIPGDSGHSLIYLFTSLLISVPPTVADVQALDALDSLVSVTVPSPSGNGYESGAVLMPPYPFSLTPAEIAAIKGWIDAGCPLGK